MKIQVDSFRVMITMACLFAAMTGTKFSLLGADAPPDTTEAPKSFFNSSPSSSKEGRDPFFPNSERPYEAAITTQPGSLSSLALNGVSGLPGHHLVIINNHTFAAGDEEDVMTVTGRIHVRCVEIRDNGDSVVVVVEAEGQREELIFRGSQ
jgi:hypothetical protein